MSRTAQETAQAIAEYEQMFGTLDYFTRDSLSCLLPLDNETALSMVIDHDATETLYDNGTVPYVIVTPKG